MNFSAAVIPFYKGEQFIRKCVDSILANDIEPEHIYIVDNGPAEKALAEVVAQTPGLKVVRTAVGLGFGRACNVGAEAALRDGASQLLITNQDTILDKGCVRALTEALDEGQGYSILAPLNYTYDFESVEGPYIQYFLSQSPALITHALKGNVAGAYEVEHIVGSCFMIKAQAVRELGLFDELYFMYSEDEDLCRRYRLAGHRIAVLPAARVAHAHSLTAENKHDKIARWTRRSRQLCILKNIDEPFWKCASHAGFGSAIDYLRSVCKLEFKEFFSFASSDLCDVLRINRIIRARNRERDLIARARAKPQCAGAGARRSLEPAISQNT